MTRIPRVSARYPRRDPGFPFHLCFHSLHKDYPAHRHEFLEFSMVVKGSGSETIDGVTHPMVPGSFTFVHPYQIHEIRVSPDDAPLVLYNCNFGMELFGAMYGHFQMNRFLLDADPSIPSHVLFQENVLDEIRSLLDESIREYESDELWRNELLFMNIIKILVRFDRYRRRHHNPVTNGAIRLESEKGDLLKILHYIHTHYRQDISLSGIAAQFHWSVPRLSELFSKRIGQSFVDHLHNLRIRHACVLLQTTEMSMAEVAYEVGYGSYSTFYRVFNEIKGMTPSAFRKSP